VDEAALVESLETGSIGGAALDVFEVDRCRPIVLLKQMENVSACPHNANFQPGCLGAGPLDTIKI